MEANASTLQHVTTLNLCKVTAAIFHAEDLRIGLIQRYLETVPGCEVTDCVEKLDPSIYVQSSTSWGGLVERRDDKGKVTTTWRCGKHFTELLG